MRGRGIALASHDDRTDEEIAENARDGIRISEFPVTMEAAAAAKRAHPPPLAATLCASANALNAVASWKSSTLGTS